MLSLWVYRFSHQQKKLSAVAIKIVVYVARTLKMTAGRLESVSQEHYTASGRLLCNTAFSIQEIKLYSYNLAETIITIQNQFLTLFF